MNRHLQFSFIQVAAIFYLGKPRFTPWEIEIANDLPLKFHPVGVRVSADVTPFGAV
jgi:hypothetical protein